MAYSAFKNMRLLNNDRFGNDTGPFQPDISDEVRTGFDLKSAVLRFLHERCEDLLFDRRIEEEEERSGIYRGTSLAPNQIPYNMQMDINRLCLERELERFMDSGATQDAYSVYYCFVEIGFAHMDALGAILLHYDLFTYSLAQGGEGMKLLISSSLQPLQ